MKFVTAFVGRVAIMPCREDDTAGQRKPGESDSGTVASFRCGGGGGAAKSAQALAVENKVNYYSALYPDSLVEGLQLRM
jgi:hypothetical protein